MGDDVQCPHCGSLNDGATEMHLEAVRPKPGDWSMCFECAGISVFTEDLHLRASDLLEAYMQMPYEQYKEVKHAVELRLFEIKYGEKRK